MFAIITNIALDITVGVAWWITKQVTYGTIQTIKYIINN